MEQVPYQGTFGNLKEGFDDRTVRRSVFQIDVRDFDLFVNAVEQVGIRISKLLSFLQGELDTIKIFMI